jgi:hypothetical protein
VVHVLLFPHAEPEGHPRRGGGLGTEDTLLESKYRKTQLSRHSFTGRKLLTRVRSNRSSASTASCLRLYHAVRYDDHSR